MVQTTMPSPQSAPRMRLQRARKQAGLRCLTLEVRETEISALVRKGLLHPDNQRDDKALRSAFYSLLDRSLGCGA